MTEEEKSKIIEDAIVERCIGGDRNIKAGMRIGCHYVLSNLSKFGLVERESLEQLLSSLRWACVKDDGINGLNIATTAIREFEQKLKKDSLNE